MKWSHSWKIGKGGLHGSTSLCFSSTCRESDRQARGHLPVGARRRAVVSGAGISSSRHLSRWEQTPGGSEEPSSKPSLFEKWAEAVRSSLPQRRSQFLPRSFILYIDFFLLLIQSKDAHLFNTVTVLYATVSLLTSHVLCFVPLSKKTSHPFTCFLIFYCQTCGL